MTSIVVEDILVRTSLSSHLHAASDFSSEKDYTKKKIILDFLSRLLFTSTAYIFSIATFEIFDE